VVFGSSRRPELLRDQKGKHRGECAGVPTYHHHHCDRGHKKPSLCLPICHDAISLNSGNRPPYAVVTSCSKKPSHAALIYITSQLTRNFSFLIDDSFAPPRPGAEGIQPDFRDISRGPGGRAALATSSCRDGSPRPPPLSLQLHGGQEMGIEHIGGLGTGLNRRDRPRWRTPPANNPIAPRILGRIVHGPPS